MFESTGAGGAVGLELERDGMEKWMSEIFLSVDVCAECFEEAKTY